MHSIGNQFHSLSITAVTQEEDNIKIRINKLVQFLKSILIEKIVSISKDDFISMGVGKPDIACIPCSLALIGQMQFRLGEVFPERVPLLSVDTAIVINDYNLDVTSNRN